MSCPRSLGLCELNIRERSTCNDSAANTTDTPQRGIKQPADWLVEVVTQVTCGPISSDILQQCWCDEQKRDQRTAETCSCVSFREFELLVLNGSWVDAPECQQTPDPHCDLTWDLGSDSNYNLRVRARCGAQMSPWTLLSPPFNRKDSKTNQRDDKSCDKNSVKGPMSHLPTYRGRGL